MNYFPNYNQQGNYTNPYAQAYNQQQQQLQQFQQPQQTLQQMQQSQQPIQPQQPQEVLKGKRVSTLEEAKASTIDFDGTPFYFPSVDNKSIYTKQVGLDGNVAILEYKLVANVAQTTQEPKNNVDYVGIIEKQNAIIENLNNRLSQVESKTENLFKELGGK